MKDWAVLKQRYERDEPSVQIGALASSLSRIGWFGRRTASLREVESLFRESKYFTEWAAPDCSLELQRLLAELQLQLAIWERRWKDQRCASTVAKEADEWSSRLLEASGLLMR